MAVAMPESGSVYTKTLKTERDQAAQLLPLIQTVLDMAGVGFKDIGLVVTTIGPGSFTGLRIGMTTAKTLGMSLCVPVQGVDSLSVMIRSCEKKQTDHGYLCVLETKRGDFYASLADQSMRQKCAPFSAMRDDILQLCTKGGYHLCGDATARFLEGVEENHFVTVEQRDLLAPEALCALGIERYQQSEEKPSRLSPLYLREADVSQSKKTQREIEDYGKM